MRRAGGTAVARRRRIETPRGLPGRRFAKDSRQLFLGRGLLRLRRGLGGRLGSGLRGRRGLLRCRLAWRSPSSCSPSARPPWPPWPASPRARRPWRSPRRRPWRRRPRLRAVLLRAARALPAAVWAPFALPALPAAMRALAALAAAALPVVLTTRPPDCTCSPPSAALTLRVRRDLRRAAAFGWIAPTLAARSSALSASSQGGLGIDRRCGRAGGRAERLRDVGLRGAATGLEDLVAALGLTDPLESRRRTSARPGAGRLGQGANLDAW